VLVFAFGFVAFLLDDSDYTHNLDEELFQSFHSLDGFTVFDFLPLSANFVFEGFGLFLVLLDEGLDLVFVEIFQFHETVLLFFGLQQLIL
jgi:hypothetical protein